MKIEVIDKEIYASITFSTKEGEQTAFLDINQYAKLQRHFKANIHYKDLADEKLNSEEFYEIMHLYRTAHISDQSLVIKRFNEVKKWISLNY